MRESRQPQLLMLLNLLPMVAMYPLIVCMNQQVTFKPRNAHVGSRTSVGICVLFLEKDCKNMGLWGSCCPFKHLQTLHQDDRAEQFDLWFSVYPRRNSAATRLTHLQHNQTNVSGGCRSMSRVRSILPFLLSWILMSCH